MATIPTKVKVLGLHETQREIAARTTPKQDREDYTLFIWIRNEECTEVHQLIFFNTAFPEWFPTSLHSNGKSNHTKMDSWLKIKCPISVLLWSSVNFEWILFFYHLLFSLKEKCDQKERREVPPTLPCIGFLLSKEMVNEPSHPTTESLPPKILTWHSYTLLLQARSMNK